MVEEATQLLKSRFALNMVADRPLDYYNVVLRRLIKVEMDKLVREWVAKLVLTDHGFFNAVANNQLDHAGELGKEIQKIDYEYLSHAFETWEKVVNDYLEVRTMGRVFEA